MSNQYIVATVDTNPSVHIPSTKTHWSNSPEVFFGGASLLISLAALCIRQSLKERESLIAHLQKQNEILLDEMRED